MSILCCFLAHNWTSSAGSMTKHTMGLAPGAFSWNGRLGGAGNCVKLLGPAQSGPPGCQRHVPLANSNVPGSKLQPNICWNLPQINNVYRNPAFDGRPRVGMKTGYGTCKASKISEHWQHLWLGSRFCMNLHACLSGFLSFKLCSYRLHVA